MRLRFAVLASALSAIAAVSAPATANAVPIRVPVLTIHASPQSIVAGNSVLIYGQLRGVRRAHRTVVLYQRVNPSTSYAFVASTTTDPLGYYEFARPVNSVLTNRTWRVRAAGIYSRGVREFVAAAVSLASTATNTTTNHAVVFYGHVDPVGFHTGETVALQVQEGSSGDDWRTIKTGLLDASSNYAITYRFVVPGERDLRVLFRGDEFNVGAPSDTLTVTVQQAENPTFTISSTAPVITAGQSADITGNLYLPAATASPTLVPDPGVTVTLWSHQSGQPFAPVSHTNTASNGSYSFTVAPQSNTVYKVTTTFPPPPIRSTAVLYEGVRDFVTLAPSTSAPTVGQRVTFTGTVTPDRAGHVIYLQLLGTDGDFHLFRIGVINSASAYQFAWTPGSPGTYVFRTVVPGDSSNVTGDSPQVTVTVGLPPVTALPTSPPASTLPTM